MNIFIKIILQIVIIIGFPFVLYGNTAKDLRDSCVSMINNDTVVAELSMKDLEGLAAHVDRIGHCKYIISTVIHLGESTCASAKIFNITENGNATPTGAMKNFYFPTALELKSEWSMVDLAEIFIIHANDDPSIWQSNGFSQMVVALKSVFPCEMDGEL